MPTIERDHKAMPPAPRSALPSPSAGPNAAIKIVLAVVAAALVFLVAVVVLFGMILAGRASTDPQDRIVTIEANERVDEQIANDLAYQYFGEVKIAQGSSLTTTIDRVESAGDIEILSVPRGMHAELTQVGPIVKLEIAVGDDVPKGVWLMTFNIASEPDPVEWAFTVL